MKKYNCVKKLFKWRINIFLKFVNFGSKLKTLSKKPIIDGLYYTLKTMIFLRDEIHSENEGPKSDLI